MAKSTFEVRPYRSSVKSRQPDPAGMEFGGLAINYNHDEPAIFVKGDDGQLITFRPGGGVAVAALPPANPKDGQLWWDTSSARLYVRYGAVGGSWVDASPAAVPPQVANALVYRGVLDVTVAKPGALTLQAGDTYVSSKAGTAHADFAGIAGQGVGLHQLLLWDGARWDTAGSAAQQRSSWQGRVDLGAAPAAGYVPTAGDLIQVSAVGSPAHAGWGTLPVATTTGSLLLHDGTGWVLLNGSPAVATATSLGVVRLADAAAIAAGTAGRIVDAAQLRAGAVAYVNCSATVPSTAIAGDLWFNTNNAQLYCYYNDGSSSQWVSISKTGPMPAVATATTPGIVKPGTNLSVAADGSLNAQVSKITVASAPPATGNSSGDFWFNTTKGILYIWYVDGSSSQWVSVMGSKAR